MVILRVRSLLVPMVARVLILQQGTCVWELSPLGGIALVSLPLVSVPSNVTNVHSQLPVVVHPIALHGPPTYCAPVLEPGDATARTPYLICLCANCVTDLQRLALSLPLLYRGLPECQLLCSSFQVAPSCYYLLLFHLDILQRLCIKFLQSLRPRGSVYPRGSLRPVLPQHSVLCLQTLQLQAHCTQLCCRSFQSQHGARDRGLHPTWRCVPG